MIALYKEAFQTFAVLCGLKKLKTTFPSAVVTVDAI